MEQQTPIPPPPHPPNQGWSRAKGKNAPFSHPWFGKGESRFSIYFVQDCSSSLLLDILKWDKLVIRRKKYEAIMMFKSLNEQAPVYLQNLFQQCTDALAYHFNFLEILSFFPPSYSVPGSLSRLGLAIGLKKRTQGKQGFLSTSVLCCRADSHRGLSNTHK